MSTTPQEQNKEVVANLLNTIVNEGDPERAAELYIGDTYIQHRHGIPDGREHFIEATKAQQRDDARLEIKRLIAEGDLVVAHFHVVPEPGHAGFASAEIYRVAGGRVVERWSVREPVPADGDPERIFG